MEGFLTIEKVSSYLKRVENHSLKYVFMDCRNNGVKGAEEVTERKRVRNFRQEMENGYEKRDMGDGERGTGNVHKA